MPNLQVEFKLVILVQLAQKIIIQSYVGVLVILFIVRLVRKLSPRSFSREKDEEQTIISRKKQLSPNSFFEENSELWVHVDAFPSTMCARNERHFQAHVRIIFFLFRELL